MFEIFREPTKKFLEKELEDMGHDPNILRPVIIRAISEAIEISEKVMREGGAFRNSRFWQKEVEEAALNYMHAILMQNDKIENLKNNINAYNSIFVVGAGISFESGVPLVSVLNHLLNFCGAKDYAELQKNQGNILKFKKEFKRICEKKDPSISHSILANHIPDKILEIICLNWDNLIELAANKMSKQVSKINENLTNVNGQRFLWKFHGDVEKITNDNVKGAGGWVLPNDNGFVFDCFLKYLEENKINENLFTVVIVGYSESDEAIYEKIIKLLEYSPKRPTYRIVLDLKKIHEDNYIVGPSDYILPKILC